MLSLKGKFGIECETLRVDSFGSLAQTPHPFGDDPHITRDFCENQIELVTPVCGSIDEALDALGELDTQVREVLQANGEHLWLYSNPPHFDSEDEIPIAAFTGDHSSKRNSERGYWNPHLPVLDHSSLRSFTDSIRKYIRNGSLHSASELYLPVRLKPHGVNTLENLAEHGVDYIELRMFDLNPDAPLGIDGRDLQFAHLPMLYLLSLPDFDFTPALQTEAVQKHKNAALIEPDAALTEQAADILHHMDAYFASFCIFSCPSRSCVLEN